MVKEIVDQMLVEAQSKVEALTKLQTEIDAEKQAAYDEGFTAGAASIGSDVVYTEAELQAKLAEAVAPLNTKVEELSAEVQLIPAKLDEAKVSVKAELAAKYAELQVAESQIETGFGDLLK